jgi:hypothetical protein
MPKVNIEGFGVVNFPDDMTPEEIQSAIENDILTRDGNKGLSFGEKATGTARSFLQGATFGFADELGLGVAALMASATEGGNFWDIYQDMKSSYTAQQKRFEEEHPVLSTGAEIAGGFATAGGAARAAAKTLPSVAARPLISTVAGGAAVGAATGAGKAENLEDVPGAALSGGGMGAAFGLGVGLAAPALMSGGRAVGRGVRRLIGRDVVSPKAAREVTKAVERDQLTPPLLSSRMRQLGPEGVVADVGENTRALGRAVTASPGTARTQAATVLRQRMNRSQQRLLGEIKEAAGSDKGFSEALTETIRRKVAQSRPLYEAAARDVVPEQNIQPLLAELDNQIIKNKGTKIGRALLAAKRSIAPDGQVKRTIEELDIAKKEIDDLISAAGRSGEKNRQRVLIDVLRNDRGTGLVQIMDNSSPTYAQARRIFADEQSVENAMKAGLKVLKEDAEVTAQRFADFSDAEKQAYVIGAMKAIRDKVLSGAEGADASRKLSSALLKERLRPIFPDEQSYQRFIRAMYREQAFAQTRNAVLGGSPTARIQEEVRDLTSHADAVVEGFLGSPVRATASALRSILGRRKDLPDKTKREIAELLFTPQGGQRVVELLRKNMKEKEIRRFLFELQGAITAGTIQATQ